MSKRRRLDPDLVLLHWLMALLFLLAIGGIVGRGLLPSGHPVRPWLRNAHMLIGQLIFVFAVLRLLVRLRSPVRPLAGLSRGAVWAGRAVHGLLYGVMLAQPLSGVLFMQAGDKTVSFLGLPLPAVVASDPERHFQLKDAHVLLGQAFYALLVLHVVAALWHHWVLKDDTLSRMLDLRRRRRARARVWAAFDDSMRSDRHTTGQPADLGPQALARLRREAWQASQSSGLDEVKRRQPVRRDPTR